MVVPIAEFLSLKFKVISLTLVRTVPDSSSHPFEPTVKSLNLVQR
jgi:hypothetical protein